MSNPKSQHYVPRMYLKRFANNGKLYVFDKNNKNLLTNFRSLPINSIAKINDYYTVKDLDGKALYEIEKKLSFLESNADIVLDKIEKNLELTAQDYIVLAFFVAFQMLRTPYFQKQIEKIMEDLQEENFIFAVDRLKEKLIELNKNPELNSTEIDQINETLKVLEKREGKFCINRNFILSQMFEGTDKENLSLTRFIALLILSRKIKIIRTIQKYQFLISDNPFLLLPSDGFDSNFEINITTPGSIIACPISNSLCMLVFLDPFYSENEAINIVEMKNRINKFEIIQSHRFVFSSDLSLLKENIRLYFES